MPGEVGKRNFKFQTPAKAEKVKKKEKSNSSEQSDSGTAGGTSGRSNRESDDKTSEEKKKRRDKKKKGSTDGSKETSVERNVAAKLTIMKSLAKQKAKKEEKEYVILRAQQVLAEFKPKSKATKLRSSDDKLPVNYARKIELLANRNNFGAIKARYLALRPSGKYADWFGKKHDEKHKHEKTMTLKERILLARGGGDKKKKKSEEKKPSDKKGIMLKPSKRNPNLTEKELADLPNPGAAPLPAVTPPSFVRNPFHKSEKELLNEKGEPLWLTEENSHSVSDNSQVEYDIVSLPVIIAHGAMVATAPELAFRDDMEFYPYLGNWEELTKIDRHFKLDRCNKIYEIMDAERGIRGPIFYNTIHQVLKVFTQDGISAVLGEVRLPEPKVKFAPTMMVAEFVPGAEHIHGHEEEMRKSAVQKPLVDVVKKDE